LVYNHKLNDALKRQIIYATGCANQKHAPLGHNMNNPG